MCPVTAFWVLRMNLISERAMAEVIEPG